CPGESCQGRTTGSGTSIPWASRAAFRETITESTTRGSRPLRPPQPRGTEKHMATKLFVGNLPHSTTDAGLSEFVTNAGFQVASAVVIRDKMTGTPEDSVLSSLAKAKTLSGQSPA